MPPFYVGQSGIELIAPVNNPAIVLDGTWTIKWYFKLCGVDPAAALTPYTGTYAGSGAQATYTLTGTELNVPGDYEIEILLTKGSYTGKCVIPLTVLPAPA